MAIEYKNKITLTKDSVIYGHQSVDDGGFPQNAGNAKVSEILDLAENQAKENLKGNVSFSVDSTNSRLYHLSLYGESVASFEVPDDKYLKSVGFDETTSKLEFTFVVEEKESIVYVDLSSLIRTYTAGDGLVLSNGKFSLVIKSGEARLKVGADGVYLDLSDITTALSGKAASDHNHDGRYYTETEMDTKLGEKADSSHTHDDRYYTESEVDTKLGKKADSSHNHDDRYYTESEMDTKLSGKAASSHTHTVSQISDLTTTTVSAFNVTALSASNAKLGTCNSVSDWNDALTCGFYMAYNATNAPEANIWFYGFCVVHNPNWLLQTLYRFCDAAYSPSSMRIYRRIKYNGSWQGWQEINSSPLKLYPVGAVYLSINSTSPASFLGGSWSQIGGGYALWTASSGAGNTIGAGLPNITGSISSNDGNWSIGSNGSTINSGALWGGTFSKKTSSGTSSGTYYMGSIHFSASSSNSIYGNSSTVQPSAYKVYAWRRTA